MVIGIFAVGLLLGLCGAAPIDSNQTSHAELQIARRVSLQINGHRYMIQLGYKLSANDAEAFCQAQPASKMHLLSIKDENEWVSRRPLGERPRSFLS